MTYVLFGYSSNQSTFYCLDPKIYRIYVSRNVKFVEDDFQFFKIYTNTQSSTVSGVLWILFAYPKTLMLMSYVACKLPLILLHHFLQQLDSIQTPP